MKSFADWTDEIRALMNPPAPAADTCNMSALDVGTAIHTALEGKWPNTVGMKLDPKWLMWADTRAVEFRKELLGEFKIGFDEGKPGGDMTATAIRQRAQNGRSRLELMHPLYVVGPQLKLAEKWADRQGWLSGPFTYIARAEQLRGIARGTELVMMVNWRSNKSKAEIDAFCEVIATHELKVRFVQP